MIKACTDSSFHHITSTLRRYRVALPVGITLKIREIDFSFSGDVVTLSFFPFGKELHRKAQIPPSPFLPPPSIPVLGDKLTTRHSGKVSICLGPPGLLSQKTIDRLENKQHKFIFNSSEGRNSEMRVPVWSGSNEGPLPDCTLPDSPSILLPR